MSKADTPKRGRFTSGRCAHSNARSGPRAGNSPTPWRVRLIAEGAGPRNQAIGLYERARVIKEREHAEEHTELTQMRNTIDALRALA